MNSKYNTLIVLAFLLLVGMCVWMTQNPWWTLLTLLTPQYTCDCEEEEQEEEQ